VTQILRLSRGEFFPAVWDRYRAGELDVISGEGGAGDAVEEKSTPSGAPL